MVTLLLGAFAAWGFAIKILIDRLRDISQKVDEHDKTDKELNNRVTAIETAMATRDDLRAMEDKLQDRIKGVETRMQGVEAKIQVIEATMATREDLHALEKNMDARFNALETLIKNSNKN